MWKGLRRQKLRSAPFPPGWRQIIETDCPFYRQLPEQDRAELEGLVQVFLAEKNFEGCGGLEVTDEIRVCVAAYACLLWLHRETDYYPLLRTVLVYPTSYIARTVRNIGSGIMQESRDVRSGESWREGAVVLAWDAVCEANRNPGSGYNVALHEFAHQLDSAEGLADGVPPLSRGESRPALKRRYAAWLRVMRAEYERLSGQVERGEQTVLRAYGATNPAEFFAVATECFFGKPHEMRREHMELYEQMKAYYRQDPAEWRGLQIAPK